MRTSKKIAICGICAAISVALMFLTSIIPTITYGIPAICGALLIIIVIEMGKKQALLVYLTVSVLSLILITNKTSALAYIVLFGYYPILKSKIEQSKNLALEIFLKAIVFLAFCIISVILYSVFIGFEVILGFGTWVILLIAIGLLVGFALYDFCLSLIVSSYLSKFRKTYFKNFFKK